MRGDVKSQRIEAREALQKDTRATALKLGGEVSIQIHRQMRPIRAKVSFKENHQARLATYGEDRNAHGCKNEAVRGPDFEESGFLNSFEARTFNIVSHDSRVVKDRNVCNSRS